MYRTGLKKAGLSATLVLAVAVGAAALATAPITPAPPAAPDQPAAAGGVAASTAESSADRVHDPLPGPASIRALDAASDRGNGDAPPVEAAETATQRTEPFARQHSASEAMHIVVSIDKRWLWLILGQDTLLSAPVAVGMNRGFEFAGRRFHFTTPRGRRTVLAKEENPVWTVPEWHYYERARQQGLEVVRLHEDSRVHLEDGTVIVVRDDDVGRINHFGNFWPFTPGNEIIFDGKVFVPPLNSRQRRVPDALGPYKLDMGNGYLIHGTHIYNEESVGRAVSHGCVRMNNEDLERLYWMVEPGTAVYIR